MAQLIAEVCLENRGISKWHTAGAQGRKTCRKPAWPFLITLLLEPGVGEPIQFRFMDCT